MSGIDRRTGTPHASKRVDTSAGPVQHRASGPAPAHRGYWVRVPSQGWARKGQRHACKQRRKGGCPGQRLGHGCLQGCFIELLLRVCGQALASATSGR